MVSQDQNNESHGYPVDRKVRFKKSNRLQDNKKNDQDKFGFGIVSHQGRNMFNIDQLTKMDESSILVKDPAS